jgi:hypothetical protein
MSPTRLNNYMLGSGPRARPVGRPGTAQNSNGSGQPEIQTIRAFFGLGPNRAGQPECTPIPTTYVAVESKWAKLHFLCVHQTFHSIGLMHIGPLSDCRSKLPLWRVSALYTVRWTTGPLPRHRSRWKKTVDAIYHAARCTRTSLGCHPPKCSNYTIFV